MKNVLRIAMMAAGLMVAAGPMAVQSQAQQVPGPHPAYLHALDDLRAARAYLADAWQWGPVQHDDQMAIQQIDAAIREIKHASIDDGKSLADHPPVDTRLGGHDRFHKANDLLRAAHEDLARAEDVPQSRGLRDRALMHIDQAHSIVDNADRTAHWM